MNRPANARSWAAPALVMALLLPAAASALMVEVPLPQLLARAADIVSADVVARQSRWTPDGSTIETEVTLRLTGSLKGDLRAGELVTVVVEGGEVGDRGIRVEHQPVFRDGESVVVCLRPGAGARAVQHLEQGKFTLVGDQIVNFRGELRARRDFAAAVSAVSPREER